MKILVLAKEVPDTASARTLDPVTGVLDRAGAEPVPDEINERTLEHALRYRDRGESPEIVVLSIGPSSVEKSIRKLLAMGADSAVVVADEQIGGADAARTSRIIAQAVARIDPDLVLAGTESTDGSGGVVPSMVAELLGWPVLPSLYTVEIGAGRVAGSVAVDGEVVEIAAEYPTIASVTEQSAEPRFPNFKGIMKAKKKPFEVWSLADLGTFEEHPAASVMVAAETRPPRAAGVKVTDDGTAVEQLVEYLAANRLI